jgi:hypothetical protein
MKPLNMTAFVRLKANGAGKPKRFSILAYSGGLLPVDGFPHPVVVDLSGLELPGSIPILIDHTKSVEATLGLTDNIHNDGTKLTLAGSITGQSALALQVLAQAAAGHTWQASIGAMVIESEDIPAGQTATANGQTFTGPVVIARRSVLRETSVLPMGADSTTSVNLAASARRFLKGSAAMSFEDYCKSLGLDAATLTPEAAAALQTSFAAMTAPAAPVMVAPVAPAPQPVMPSAAASVMLDLTAALETNRKAISAQFRKSAEIQAKASGFPNIIATAIDQDWSLDKVELEVMKAKEIQARGTRVTSFQSAQNTPEQLPLVLEAALCSTRGIKDTEKQFDDKTLQAAHSQFRRGAGLQQIMLMAAAANGMPMSAGLKITTGNIREVLSYACPDGRTVSAAFTAISLPGILSNVANKELLQGYMEEDMIWKEIAQTKSVSDFKTVTSYRLLDDMSYDKLGPGGVMKHGTLSEESFTRSVDTYAKMASLTRQDIINDDLSAFDDLRNRIGRGGAMKLNDLFWSTFLGNLATIFTATRTNYITGATTNLGTDGVGLGLGQKAWRQRTTPTADGAKRLSGTAKFLLVPPELETVADALYGARNIAAVKVSDVNTFANKYTPIVANQLSDSSISGYSTTAWYLLGDKSQGTPVVVSFLNGQETPTVESADADFNQLGIQFRGYHDFGCDLGDGYLNALMSKGAA